MGNEISISNEQTENGNIPEKHENGSVNGISANITSNGLEIDVKGETTVQQNGEPLSLSLATKPSEPESTGVKSESEPAEAQVISEVPEPPTQKEESKRKRDKVKLFGKVFKKKAADVKSDQEKEASNEDQPDAADPQTIFIIEESSLSGEEDDIAVIIEHRDFQHLHQSKGADQVLVEIAEPESTAFAPEVQEASGVPSLDEGPAILEVETASEFVRDKSALTPVPQDMPTEECPAYEEITDYPAAVELRNKKCGRFHNENYIIVEVAAYGLTTIRELCEDCPDDHYKPESSAEGMTTDENIEIGEDVASTLEADCNLVTSQEVAPVTIMDGEADKKAEHGTSGTVTKSAQDSQSADMVALLVGLQSACELVVETSAYRLAGLELSSAGHSVAIAIRVAPQTERQ